MKMSYIAPCVGACTLLMFTSCKSTDGDGYAETAIPISEVADGEIPPWLQEDDGSHGPQVDAGSRTPTYSRNDFFTPEPTEENTGSATTSQNQPKLADGQDTPYIDTPIQPSSDPLLTPQAPVEKTTPSRPTTGTGGKKPNAGGKKSPKPTKPTLVIYKVRPGDNLSEIAKRSNTTVAQIMRDSKLSGTTIYPGQTIKVRYTPSGYKGSSTKGSGSKGGKTHTVTSGQTLSGIAKRYGISTAQLMKANGLTEADARKIRPGQKLTIPSAGKKKKR